MKKGLHPVYREVIFKDISTNFSILSRSTVQTKDTAKWEDGNEYPVYTTEISSASHPFFTGQDKILDTAGRVEKFKARRSKAATPKK